MSVRFADGRELVSAQYLKAKRKHLYPAHLWEQAFIGLYVEALSEARTQLAVIFSNLNKGGATGFDGDTEITVACRALGNS